MQDYFKYNIIVFKKKGGGGWMKQYYIYSHYYKPLISLFFIKHISF